MEGLFETSRARRSSLIGQPDMDKRKLDNPHRGARRAQLPHLSAWSAEVKGLDAFPRDRWPDNIPLLYYSYHIMVGLGTIFIAIMLLSRASAVARQALSHAAGMLWILMLIVPFPYIANTAGWMTAELGRQPWLIYGLMRTADGVSPRRFGRQRAVHAAGLHGHVHRPRDSLPLPGLARDRAWPGPECAAIDAVRQGG